MEDDEKTEPLNTTFIDLSFSDFQPAASSTLIEGRESEAEARPTLAEGQGPHRGPQSTGPEGPPRPIGPRHDTDKIVTETRDIADGLLKLTFRQRRFLNLECFHILSTRSLLEDSYHPLVSRVNAYLVHSERLQTRWFLQYRCLLPQYGDYLPQLEEEDGDAEVEVETAPPVRRTALRRLAQQVTQLMEAGALLAKSHLALCEEVGRQTVDWPEVRDSHHLHFRQWLDLCAMQSEYVEKLEKSCFNVHSNIDFMNAGSVNPKSI